jgi:ketosteroid isomerase-like protein
MSTPEVVSEYFRSAAAGDLDTLLSCFAPDAYVADQDESFTGRAEIRGWREALASAFTYTTEITGSEQDGDEYVVTIHVEGDFPGGVVDLTNRFTVVDGLIARLVI